MIFLLAACAPSFEGEVYPIQTVHCTHLLSLYEATLYIEARDPFDWDTIAVDVDQGDNDWSAQLREVEDNVWGIEMNLMELDCTADYDLGLYYLTYQ